MKDNRYSFVDSNIVVFTELRDKNNSLEGKISRMMAAFKQKSHKMREVVYRLTGYRVDLRDENVYKLINSFSDSTDDYLLFKEDAEGNLDLLETDFSSRLFDLIETYLQKGNSFPAFLSALTVELYNRTIQQNMSSDEEDLVERINSPSSSEEEVVRDQEVVSGSSADEDEEDDDDDDEEQEEEEEGMDEEEMEEDEGHMEEEEEPMDQDDSPAGSPLQPPPPVVQPDDDDDDDLICLD